MRALYGIQPVAVCPHCTVLVNGSCEVCTEGSTHPSCSNCVGGNYIDPTPMPLPYGANNMLHAVIAAIAVSVVSGLVISNFKAARKCRN